MIFQRVVIATLFPLVVGSTFYPVSTGVNTVPLCHDTYNERDFSRKSEVDVKKFLAINKMCPIQLPDLDQPRKMAFTLNPFRSDSMTISDGIVLFRCMIAHGLLKARIGVSRGVGTSRNMILSGVELGAENFRSASRKIQRFCSEPFTFAEHIMPERGAFTNGFALIISVIFAILSLALQFHQRTLAKLLRKDKISIAKVDAAQQSVVDNLGLYESSEHAKASNRPIEQQVISPKGYSSQEDELPFLSPEQKAVTEKSLGPGENSSEGSESSSTFLETPPPTPPRYMVELNTKKASKAAKDEMTVMSTASKKRRRFGLKLRRKKKDDSTV